MYPVSYNSDEQILRERCWDLDPQTVYRHPDVDSKLEKRMEKFVKELPSDFFNEFIKSSKFNYSLSVDVKEIRSYRRIIGTFKNNIDFFCDGTYGFMLDTDSNTIAYSSFKKIEDRFDIVQIQGVKGKASKLSRVDWAALLISTILEFGKAEKQRTISVKPAKLNSWVIQKHISLEKALDRYDNKAKQLGFRYDKGIDRYVKYI